MRRISYSLIVTLLMVTLVALTSKSAEAGAALSTWAAIKNDDSAKDSGAVKAAPPGDFGRRDIWKDGLVHAQGAAKVNVQSPGWREILADIGTSLDGDTLAELTNAPAAAVDVEVTDINGNPITQIKRGNPIRVFADHASIAPLKGTCILVLPVNNPVYKETMMHLREYAGSGVTAEWYYFHIPDLIQIEGKAIIIVKVAGIGKGFATLEVLP